MHPLATITPHQMSGEAMKAVNKCNSPNEWNSPSQEEEQIIALCAKIKELQKSHNKSVLGDGLRSEKEESNTPEQELHQKVSMAQNCTCGRSACCHQDA